MKKLSKSIIAILLTVCMMMPVFAAWSAAEDIAEDYDVVFTLEKISEDEDSIKLSFNLTQGSLLCVDAQITSGKASCKEIDFGDEIKAFLLANPGTFATNPNDGKLSLASVNEIEAPIKIADLTFEKSESFGATKSDFTVNITACYQKDDNGNDVAATFSIESTIGEEHTHTPASKPVVKEPTCTENGESKLYCITCGELIEEHSIDALKHKNAYNEHKDPDCTHDGYDKIYCPDCKTYIKDEKIDATGHKNTHNDTKAATCTEEGYIKVICDDCNEIISTTVLKVKDHKYIKETKQATCTDDGYIKIKCSSCNDVQSQTTLKSTGHSYSDWIVKKEPTYRSEGLKRKTCRNCGDNIDEKIPMIVVPVESIVIVPEKNFTINYKKVDRLQATVFPEEAAYSAEIIWESSNPKIVSVDQDGIITAKGIGTAVITAKTADGTVEATRRITVQYSTWQWIIVYLLFGWIWYV